MRNREHGRYRGIDLASETDEIDPDPGHWPVTARFGFGVVAMLPFCLLIALCTVAIARGARGSPELVSVMAMGFYVYVGTQFLVTLVYVHLVTDAPQLGPRAKIGWCVALVALPPIAPTLYWIEHVLGEPVASRRVQVYETVGRRPEAHSPGRFRLERASTDRPAELRRTEAREEGRESNGPPTWLLAVLGLVFAPFVALASLAASVLLMPFALLVIPPMIVSLLRWPLPKSSRAGLSSHSIPAQASPLESARSQPGVDDARSHAAYGERWVARDRP